MRRPPDERANISAGRLAGEYSTRLRKNLSIAIPLAVAVGGLSLVTPRVRPHAIHRALRKIEPNVGPTAEGEAVHFVLRRIPRALGLFVARHPEWTARLIASLEKQSPATVVEPQKEPPQ